MELAIISPSYAVDNEAYKLKSNEFKFVSKINSNMFLNLKEQRTKVSIEIKFDSKFNNKIVSNLSFEFPFNWKVSMDFKFCMFLVRTIKNSWFNWQFSPVPMFICFIFLKLVSPYPNNKDPSFSIMVSLLKIMDKSCSSERKCKFFPKISIPSDFIWLRWPKSRFNLFKFL